jgi:hypothetical protein
MSVQTNFTAADMIGGIAYQAPVTEVVEEKKVIAKPAAKKVEAKVEEVQPEVVEELEVVAEPEAEVVAEETPEVK